MQFPTRSPLLASVVAALVAIPIGVLASQAAFAADTSVPSKSRDAQTVEADLEPALPTTTDGGPDTDAIHASAQPLGDCPELLEFLTSPEVNEFQTTYFGDPYTAETRFYPTCPDVDYMREMYDAGRERILGDSK